MPDFNNSLNMLVNKGFGGQILKKKDQSILTSSENIEESKNQNIDEIKNQNIEGSKNQILEERLKTKYQKLVDPILAEKG